MFYQQGDVLIKKVSAIPKDAMLKNNDPRGIVLAEGEATGHYHAITEVDMVESFEHDKALYLRVHGPVTITHQEHKPITIDPGTYQIGIVREYDWFTEEIRNVKD